MSLRGSLLQYNWIKCVKSVEQLTASPRVSFFSAPKMDDFCGTVSSWKHYIMTNWVTPQGGHVCDRQNSQRESNAHTFIFIALLCHSQLCLFAIIFFQFVLIDISARFSLILLLFFVHVVLQLLHHFLCLSLLTCFASISCTSGSLSPPSFTLLGTKTPTSPPPSFFSLFRLPPPFHIHRLPTAPLSLPPLVLPSTRVPLLVLLAVYLCVSV